MKSFFLTVLILCLSHVDVLCIHRIDLPYAVDFSKPILKRETAIKDSSINDRAALLMYALTDNFIYTCSPLSGDNREVFITYKVSATRSDSIALLEHGDMLTDLFLDYVLEDSARFFKDVIVTFTLSDKNVMVFKGDIRNGRVKRLSIEDRFILLFTVVGFETDLSFRKDTVVLNTEVKQRYFNKYIQYEDKAGRLAVCLFSYILKDKYSSVFFDFSDYEGMLFTCKDHVMSGPINKSM